MIEHHKLRLLLQLGPESEGFGEGSWTELTGDLRSTPFRRGAVTTDDATIRTGLALLRFTLHGHSLANHEYDRAAEWVAA